MFLSIAAASSQAVMSDIQSAGSWGYILIMLMVTMEATLFLSVFSFGTELVVLAGALAAQGTFQPVVLVGVVALGAIIGSTLSYWIGVFISRFLSDETRDKLLKTKAYRNGKSFYDKHGEVSVFLSHFLGPLRPILPASAGFLHMKFTHFMTWNIAGGIAYAVISVALGYFFGDVFQSLSPSQKRILIWSVAAIIGLAIIVLFIRHLQKKKARNTA